jgi:hypothetical protein
VDGTDGVDDVTVCYGNIGVAVEGNKQGAGRERVARVEGIADMASSIDRCPNLKGCRRLHIMVEWKVLVGVVIIQVGVG